MVKNEQLTFDGMDDILPKKGKQKKQHVQHNRIVKLENDFWDYDSKIAGTTQLFGDTRPFIKYNQMSYELLNSLFHSSGIAHKIVTKPAEDATRNGWRIIIPDDTAKQATYQKALDNLDLKQVLSKELIYQRLHGDGYINIAVSQEADKADLAKPLGEIPDIDSVAFVHAFGQTHVQENIVSDDPTDPNYMKEIKLVLKPTRKSTDVNNNGDPQYQTPETKKIVVDKSRYFHISLDKMEDDNTGNSILNRCYDQIKVLDTALYSVGKIIYGWNINVVYSQTMGADDSIETDMMFSEEKRQFKDGMSTDSVLLLNDGERFERASTNVSGLSDLLTFAWQNLAAASNIPKSVLLGEQAGTLAGATQDVANYYDGIKAIQEELLRPQLERIIELLMWSRDVADGSENPASIDWKLEFNPLWTPDDSTKAEITNKDAQTAQTMFNIGAWTTDQANDFVKGQSHNSIAVGSNSKDKQLTKPSDDELAKQIENKLKGEEDG